MTSLYVSLAMVSALSPSPRMDDEVTIESMPPVVVKCVPEAGSKDVDAKTTEIKVTFSKDMQDKSWSWVQVTKENYPETTGDPKYLKDKRTCVLPVKLEPGKTYAIGLTKRTSRTSRTATGTRRCRTCSCSKRKSNRPKAAPCLSTIASIEPGAFVVVFGRIRGDFDQEDAYRYQREVWTRPEYAGFNELFDMSEVNEDSLAGMSANTVQALADSSAALDPVHGPSKLAIVAASDLSFGMGRMFQAYRGLAESSTQAVEVFRTLPEALAFLGLDDPGVA